MTSISGRMLVSFALLTSFAAPPAEAKMRKCTDTSDFDIIMQEIEAAIPCADAKKHGRYIKKAKQALAGQLKGPCKQAFAKRFIKQSTCGRPGTVVCCRSRKGQKGSTVLAAKKCKAPCSNGFRSVGEACTPEGACVTTTTTTTTSATSITTTTTSTTTTTTTCGNGVIDAAHEECDGADLGGRNCDCTGGRLRCTSACKIDFTGCQGVQRLTLDFTNGQANGQCGEIRDASGQVLETLGCGDLNLGGGSSQTLAGATPDGSTSRFDLLCTCSSCTIRPTSARPAVDSSGPDCTDTGCYFGTPLRVPNSFQALSVCAVNTWAVPATGTLDLSSGAVTLNVPLSSEVHLTGAALCPLCSASGSPSSPGHGTCDSGARADQPCTSTNSEGLTRDCPPNAVVGKISVNLSPLRTEPVDRIASATGQFCPDQTDGQVGCFGNPACRAITENGTPAGALGLGIPRDVTLASVFCVPSTGDPGLDGSADLPGPGAVSLPGRLLLSEPVDTTSTTATPPPTTTSPPSTTTTTTTTSTTTTSTAPPSAGGAFTL